ncbi:Uncharacterised protein [Chromobacterium violaceum]|uniref:Uncharacterized protein n=1 Tax=Chromobacterium violaceum TaxID=536 RepID=A0A447T447_CHRVL|nr:Uncharacterised protein [Chromobacterium violaceum]
MKLNKKHWIALAAVAIALLGLIGAAYWVMTRGEGRVERLDLANEQNSQLADALLDKIYGHGSYDPKQRCWKQTSDYMYFCMKPVSLDRVETGESSKLYLLAGAMVPANPKMESPVARTRAWALSFSMAKLMKYWLPATSCPSATMISWRRLILACSASTSMATWPGWWRGTIKERAFRSCLPLMARM